MLGVAIIGCGDMGAKHAAAWAARDDVRIVAVCDQDSDRVDAFAERYGATAYSDWREAIAQSDVNLVSICILACYHRDVAVEAAALGRHILCEKAMALTLSEADDMIAAAEANNVRLSVCHQYRGLSRFKKMKELIESGRIGSPIYLRFTEMREVRPKLAMHSLSGNGGPAHDMTGHLFDLARFLTKSEATSIAAVGSVFGKGKERLQSVSDFGTDTAEIQTRFAGGHCLSIGIGWGLPEDTAGYSHEVIHGPKGIMYSEDPAHPDRFLGDPTDTAVVVVKDGDGLTRFECEPDNDGPHICIAELLEAIRSRTRSQFDGREGRAALRLILGALEAVETGQLVEF